MFIPLVLPPFLSRFTTLSSNSVNSSVKFTFCFQKSKLWNRGMPKDVPHKKNKENIVKFSVNKGLSAYIWCLLCWFELFSLSLATSNERDSTVNRYFGKIAGCFHRLTHGTLWCAGRSAKSRGYVAWHLAQRWVVVHCVTIQCCVMTLKSRGLVVERSSPNICLNCDKSKYFYSILSINFDSVIQWLHWASTGYQLCINLCSIAIKWRWSLNCRGG